MDLSDNLLDKLHHVLLDFDNGYGVQLPLSNKTSTKKDLLMKRNTLSYNIHKVIRKYMVNIKNKINVTNFITISV